MRDVRVKSWLELLEALDYEAWNPRLKRFRSSFAFRGVSRLEHDLSPSLLRLGGSFERQEEALLRAFRKYARTHGADCASMWDWLALAQHHGLPTRLLDWTYSPYVALHFATCEVDDWNVDGVIWCVDYVRTNRLLPLPLKRQLQTEHADAFTAEMLASAAESLADFDRLSRHAFVLFFEPPSLDERIINQFALFSLMNRAPTRLEPFLARQKSGVRRLVIPASLKPEVRDKLDQANITERVLFPGLDGLCRWLQRYYAPRALRCAQLKPPPHAGYLQKTDKG